MFGVWGSRTQDGSIYTARNLDWAKDLGIAKYKLITVYHPNDGKYAHATLGYLGFTGALAGMSSQGITVHEANLESNDITFGGFPWVLRLRYIMENAQNLQEGKTLWENTNNTVGFNHMIGSASDAKSVAMETMSGYTAYFLDNDPREQAGVWINATNGQQTKIGFPIPEAVYRTNHAYDPTILKHFTDPYEPTSWTVQRYLFMYKSFSWYQQQSIKISDLQAINITSIVGDKGRANPHVCSNTTDGENVLSVTFHPGVQQLYVAWEDGTGNTWRPAVCNTYIKIDFNYWWNKQ